MTAQFNSKAKINRRDDAETETVGGKSLSRYFCALSYRKKAEPKPEIQIVEIPVPVLAVFKGPARHARAPLWRM